MTNNRIANGGLAALPFRRHLIHSFSIAFLILGMGIAAAAPDQHCSATGICKQQPPGTQRPAGAIASAVEAAQKVEQAAAEIARKAKANRERGIHGGMAGAEYEERCPADQVVVGFEGTTTPQRLQQIRLICAQIRPGGRLGDRAVVGERIGGPVGSRTQVQCPDDNSAMVGFRVGLTGKDGEASTLVRRIALRCGLLEPPHRQLQVDRSVGPQTASPVAVDGGACPAATPMVVGVRGQHRGEINSLGVICGAMPQPLPAPTPAADVCPGALATVTIMGPGVNRLNVRASPGGMVLTTIDNGSRVSVVGGCGPERAAGIAAPSGGSAGSGWCQIDKPVIGCVSSEYLSFGTVGISPSPPQEQVSPPPGAMNGPAHMWAADPVRVIKPANVRARPNGPKIATLPAGAIVLIGPCEGQWCPVLSISSADGAWVHRSLLQPVPRHLVNEAPPQSFVREGPLPGTCAPGGLATVVIPDPSVNRLNVRAAPGGAVLTTIAKGSLVSVLGECGPERAAGIAAPSGGSGGSGWCQIDKPVIGCVVAQYLAFGSASTRASGPDTAVGIASPPPGPTPQATAVQVSPGAATFAGVWESNVDGISHALTLVQNGANVSGNYVGTDGSTGQITGTTSGNVFRFSWVQAGGHRGSGKFTLSGDGRSFFGSYNFGQNPDESHGTWNGRRR